jgi:hypothetical protein
MLRRLIFVFVKVFVAEHVSHDLLVKLFQAESAMTSMMAMQTKVIRFNKRFAGKFKPDKLKQQYADTNNWPEMHLADGLHEMGEIVHEHAPKLLKRTLNMIPVIFPSCEPALLKVRPYDTFGDIYWYHFSELAWKNSIFYGRFMPKTPNAS